MILVYNQNSLEAEQSVCINAFRFSIHTDTCTWIHFICVGVLGRQRKAEIGKSYYTVTVTSNSTICGAEQRQEIQEDIDGVVLS